MEAERDRVLTGEEIRDCISKCLGTEIDSVLGMDRLRDRSGREVLDCRYQAGGVSARHILKAYHRGCDDDSELGIANLALKAHLSGLELAALSIRVPHVFGSYLSDEVSCVLMERLEPTPWAERTRLEAAEILSRLHNVPVISLSHDLRQLVTDSKPNRDRGRLGVVARSQFLDRSHPGWRAKYPELAEQVTQVVQSYEPVSSMTTLVHGDYFSVNLVPTAEGLYVIDWDLLALGDPMWDLGFLVGADRGVSEEEVEQVVQVYARTRQVDYDVLRWQQTCWKSLLGLIELMHSDKDVKQ